MYFESGLILEGGGMRGVYTAGVTDFFLEKDIMFNEIYGVSAGSANAASYISEQKRRALHVDIDFLKDKRYASMYSLMTTGNFFGTDMCYDKIPNELLPYDYEQFNKYQGKFYAVATDCITGKAEYFRIKDMRKDIDKIRASCSLPLMAEVVIINGKPYLDGGISDSIPIRRSIVGGNKKNVIVLTRDITYRKEPNSLMPAIRLLYKKYPELTRSMEKRHLYYNRELEYIENLEKQGKVFVIRPSSVVEIGRLEKNKYKLVQLYKQGYNDAKSCYDSLMNYLNS